MGKVLTEELKVFHEKQRLMDEARGPVIPGCPICGAARIDIELHREWHEELW